MKYASTGIFTALKTKRSLHDQSCSRRCTGIFQNGGIGLARLSLARQHIPSFTPGMAVKVFVDKHPSLNFHVGSSCHFLRHISPPWCCYRLSMM